MIEALLAFLSVYILSQVGAFLIRAMRGYTFANDTWLVGGKSVPGCLGKDTCTAVMIPPFIGMLLFGCLGRNFMPFSFMNSYPDKLASLSRGYCTNIIFLRIGMGLDISNLGKATALLTVIPPLVEAMTLSYILTTYYGMNTAFSYSLGYIINAIGPAVVLPPLLAMQKDGYGEDKGITSLILASTSASNVLSIIVFQLTMAYGMGQVGSSDKVLLEIDAFMLFSKILMGVIGGYFMGKYMRYFYKESHKLKAIVVLLTALLFMMFNRFFGLMLFDYIASIVFGFVCNRVWGAQGKPANELVQYWFYLEPLLFGTAGANLNFGVMSADTVVEGIYVSGVGCAFRFIATFLTIGMLYKQYNLKEAIFVSCAQLCKGTLQAALSDKIQSQAILSNLSSHVVEQGSRILTFSLASIIIWGPLGATLMMVFGKSLLTTNKVNEELQIPLNNMQKTDNLDQLEGEEEEEEHKN